MVKIRRIFLPGMVAAIQITNTNWRNPTDLSPPTDEWNYSNNNSANKHSSVDQNTIPLPKTEIKKHHQAECHHNHDMSPW
jgi:hypothetical protein